MQKVTVGILSYRDQAYLELALPTILDQTHPALEILICDNNDKNPEIAKWISQSYPAVKILNAGGNVGFGKGHNFLISQAKGDFYLCFNSDMFASPNYIEQLLKPFATDSKIAVTTGKILKWANFPASPVSLTENYIDTVGLQPTSGHHFFELGHAKQDLGQYDSQQEIWGCSGASPMFKIESLKQIQHTPNEFFDKNFFMYKEDIDLMYRLRWAGFKAVYTPSAIAWHDRTAEDPGGIVQSIKKRYARPLYIKENSFLNHLIFVYKNWSSDYSLKTKFKTFLFFLKYTFYLLIFDPQILKMYPKFTKLIPELKEKREKMPRKISASAMEHWFI